MDFESEFGPLSVAKRKNRMTAQRLEAAAWKQIGAVTYQGCKYLIFLFEG